MVHGHHYRPQDATGPSMMLRDGLGPRRAPNIDQPSHRNDRTGAGAPSNTSRIQRSALCEAPSPIWTVNVS